MTKYQKIDRVIVTRAITENTINKIVGENLMMNYKLIISIVLLLGGTLSYAKADKGFMQQIGTKISPYVPQPVKTWYQQRQEEQKLRQIFPKNRYPGKEETKMLQSLLNQGLDPNRKSAEHNYSLLALSAIYGQPDWMSMLLKAGARPDSSAIQQSMVFHDKEKTHAMLKALLDGGLNPNFQDPKTEDWTPLHYAALYNRPDLAELLIAHGANPELKNRDGETSADLKAFMDKRKKTVEEQVEKERGKAKVS
jgi:hypothetical protein